MPYYAKVVSVFLLATVKFFYAPLYAYLIDLQPIESYVTILSGGIISFLFFYYISYFIIISTRYIQPVARKVTPNPVRKKFNDWLEIRETRRQNRRVFTKRNRMMVRLRMVGMWAVILTTPVLLSIPFGAFILRKYYERKRGVVWFALLVIALEGAVLCWLIWNVPDLRPE
jgi:hypothetical protein